MVDTKEHKKSVLLPSFPLPTHSEEHREGALELGTADILGGIILCHVGYPKLFRVFGGTPHLSALESSSPPLKVTAFKTSPHMPPAPQNNSQLRTMCVEVKSIDPRLPGHLIPTLPLTIQDSFDHAILFLCFSVLSCKMGG